MAEQAPAAAPELPRHRPGWRPRQRRLATPADVVLAEAHARSAAENAAWALKELEHARRHGARHEVRVAKQVERAARHEARLARHHARAALTAARRSRDPDRATLEDRHRDALFIALYVAYVFVAGTLMVMLAMDIA